MADDTDEAAAGNQWNLEPQESGFVAFWPHQEACSRAEFLAAVEAWVGEAIEHDVIESANGDGELWALRLQVPGIESGLVVWCEGAGELSARDQEQVGESALKAPWVIRMQLILSAEEPAEEYFMVMGLLGGSLPDVVAVLDVNTGEICPRERIDQDFVAESAVPTDRPLWKLARYGPLPGGTEGFVVLATQGLARCGLPELEMDEVPVGLADQASVVLFALTGMLLDGDLPAPGGQVSIGEGMTISLQRVDDVVQFIEAGTAGSAQWREAVRTQGYDEFGFERAVICASEQVGQFTKAWTWPKEVVERIASDRAVMYMSERWINHTKGRAQASWPSFAMAFLSLLRTGKAEWIDLARKSFVVQAPLAAGEDGRIEHSWLSVHAIDHDRVQVRVLEQPITRPDLQPGDLVDVSRPSVADWRVQMAGILFDPDDSEQLLRAVDRVRGINLAEDASNGAPGEGAGGTGGA